MRKILWHGHKDVFEDPGVRRRIATGAIRPDDLERLRRIDHARIGAFPGRSEFVLGPAHGASRTYVFGPQVFEVWMDDADAALLVGDRAHPRDRAMFRDVTDVAGVPGPDPLRGGGQELIEASASVPGPRVVPARR